MQFVPLWTSILRSRKVAALPDDLYRTWTLCLATAQEHDHAHGSLPSVDDLSYSLHMSHDNCLSRLSRLVTADFLDFRDGIYYIHDWSDWKHRPDPTATARKRAQREREREQLRKTKVDAERNGRHEEADSSENVTVTSVTSEMSQCHAPTQLNSPTPQQHTPLPPVSGGGRNACECEPFEPEENPEIQAILVIPWTPEEKRIIDRATQRWGASYGDVGVGDLLKTYPAGLVAEACDRHFGHVQAAYNLPRLQGLCRTLWNEGKWRPSASSRSSGGPTNQPAEVPAESMSKYQAEADEAAAKYGRSPAEYREKVKRGELPKPKM